MFSSLVVLLVHYKISGSESLVVFNKVEEKKSVTGVHQELSPKSFLVLFVYSCHVHCSPLVLYAFGFVKRSQECGYVCSHRDFQRFGKEKIPGPYSFLLLESNDYVCWMELQDRDLAKRKISCYQDIDKYVFHCAESSQQQAMCFLCFETAAYRGCNF